MFNNRTDWEDVIASAVIGLALLLVLILAIL